MIEGRVIRGHNLVHGENNLYEKKCIKFIWEIPALWYIFKVGHEFDYAIENRNKVFKGPGNWAIKLSKC